QYFIISDLIVFLFTPLMALQLRLDLYPNLADVAFNQAFYPYHNGLLLAIILFPIVKMAILWVSGCYKRYWFYATFDDLVQLAIPILMAVILEAFLFKGLSFIALEPVRMPRSIPLLEGILSILLVIGSRLSIPALVRFYRREKTNSLKCRILIVGAGDGGNSLARDIRHLRHDPQLALELIAFIDDDPKKRNLYIQGVPVVGDRAHIPEVVQSLRIDRIVVAIPSASGVAIREILEICQATGLPTITLPGQLELLHDPPSWKDVRDIQIEDLLRREPIQTDIHKVAEFIRGKRVMVTGGGGSIGSELCRQILRCRPAELFLLGKGENSVFTIQQELEPMIKRLFPGKTAETVPIVKILPGAKYLEEKYLEDRTEEDGEEPIPTLRTFIADIRSTSRLNQAFAEFRPEVVFHAAAHKHVPLMEQNVPEAISSNVMGTKNLLDMALKYNVSHFVMISTDKAVNPTNVMGASKRMAEMLVLQAAQRTGKPYVVVRFGNVLGSRGSVVPTFQKQIALGGPITITHPDICRYFMTIPEAVQLVLQAALLSQGGEVMMLDMGQPIKIVDLARDMIRLSGHKVGEDIDIVFTGLRPGEKLFEELFIEGEQYERTQHEKILIARNASQHVPVNLSSTIDVLSEAAARNDDQLIISLLEQMVTGYKPQFSKESRDILGGINSVNITNKTFGEPSSAAI
ncbi:MAG: nucleoside-diphosphate sugar epimerase/dehydratase, partial [Kovacikia sp.]